MSAIWKGWGCRKEFLLSVSCDYSDYFLYEGALARRIELCMSFQIKRLTSCLYFTHWTLYIMRWNCLYGTSEVKQRIPHQLTQFLTNYDVPEYKSTYSSQGRSSSSDSILSLFTFSLFFHTCQSHNQTYLPNYFRWSSPAGWQSFFFNGTITPSRNSFIWYPSPHRICYLEYRS